MKGLIIKEPWIDLILDGKKTWEIRGSNTSIRGEIALIKSGTGMVYGTVVLTNSFPITQTAYNQGWANHRIPETVEITYLKPHVWELSAPKRFDKPIPYTHPQGAVIWVNIKCRSCEGQGYYFTGVEHCGMQQTEECQDCEGTGIFNPVQVIHSDEEGEA